jgi:hypothetical protein
MVFDRKRAKAVEHPCFDDPSVDADFIKQHCLIEGRERLALAFEIEDKIVVRRFVMALATEMRNIVAQLSAQLAEAPEARLIKAKTVTSRSDFTMSPLTGWKRVPSYLSCLARIMQRFDGYGALGAALV